MRAKFLVCIHCHSFILHAWCHDKSHAVVALGKLLFPIFALALDLPEDFFADKVTAHLLLLASSAVLTRV